MIQFRVSLILLYLSAIQQPPLAQCKIISSWVCYSCIFHSVQSQFSACNALCVFIYQPTNLLIRLYSSRRNSEVCILPCWSIHIHWTSVYFRSTKWWSGRKRIIFKLKRTNIDQRSSPQLRWENLLLGQLIINSSFKKWPLWNSGQKKTIVKREP